MPTKPINIVYLHAHDAGRYIQPYGYAVPTPSLQKFAEEGVLFRNAFCANPTCSPSRACLHTGQYAHENGMLGLAHRGFTLNNYEDTLANFLRNHGWYTALSGIQHIAAAPYANIEDIGYHEIFDVKAGGMGINATALKITSEAESFLGRDHDSPFFLDVGYFHPHRSGSGFPAIMPAPDPTFLKPPGIFPDTKETRKDYSQYIASVATFDALAGRVLNAIKENGLEENTLVVITTDHGLAFPNMKCRLTDHGIGVLLMMRGPNGFYGGKAIDAMVTHLDIFPTICEVTGLQLPARLQGKSVQPLVDNSAESIHETIFAEVNFHAAYEPMRAARTDRWKYIRKLHNRKKPTLPNTDNGLTKTYLHENGWSESETNQEELYDLILDPMESNNLAENTDQANILATMRQKMDQWMKDTNDPFLSQEVLSHENKIVTDSDAYSPAG